MAYTPPSPFVFTIDGGYSPPSPFIFVVGEEPAGPQNVGVFQPPLAAVSGGGHVSILAAGAYFPLPPAVSGTGDAYFSQGDATPPIATVTATGFVTIVADGAYAPTLPTIFGSDHLNVGEVSPALPAISGYGFSAFAFGDFAPGRADVTALGSTPIVGAGRFKPQRPQVVGFGYRDGLGADGQYAPIVAAIEAQAVTSIYGWVEFSCKIPITRGEAGLVPDEGVITGHGQYAPPPVAISGESTRPIAGDIRFSPPLTQIGAYGLRSCFGSSTFVPPLPKIRCASSSLPLVPAVMHFHEYTPGDVPIMPGPPVTVLEYGREVVLTSALQAPTAPLNPLSFTR